MSMNVRTKYRTHSMSCDLIHCVRMHTYTHMAEITYRVHTQLVDHERGSKTKPSVSLLGQGWNVGAIRVECN